MSQHHFYIQHNGMKTYVLMGWDRPLQGFFLVIQKEDDKEDAPFWSNLDTENPHPKSLEPFLTVLQKLDIEVPSAMIEEINRDKFDNIGNKQVLHKITATGYKRVEGSWAV